MARVTSEVEHQCREIGSQRRKGGRRGRLAWWRTQCLKVGRALSFVPVKG